MRRQNKPHIKGRGKTMYSMQDLISEIAAKVDNLRSLGASDSELNPDWIAQDIINDHVEKEDYWTAIPGLR
jgi:hypothetical protein